ncbi:MAG: hypothetical protein ABR910_07545 [Acidobacteriaceae bacterium]
MPSKDGSARPNRPISLRAPIVLLALALAAGRLAAQSVAAAGSGSPADLSNLAPKAMPPSAALGPALDVLKQAIEETNIDRWKASGAVRDEAQNNLRSIERDVDATLPPLLAAADTAPYSPAQTLPAYRNIEALYDVLLRLEAAGQLAAPRDQASALQQALDTLNDGRRALGDQLQQNAEAQQRQITTLRAQPKAVPPPAPPPAAPTVCPPIPAKKKAKPTAKAASTASPGSSTTPH